MNGLKTIYSQAGDFLGLHLSLGVFLEASIVNYQKVPKWGLFFFFFVFKCIKNQMVKRTIQCLEEEV